MKIIIIGGGKTGATLAQTLTDEGHDVVVIDQNAERIAGICNNNDVMGLTGNGMNFSALSEAGIAEADLLIAVTGSDEQNLLCSLLQKKELCLKYFDHFFQLFLLKHKQHHSLRWD